MLKTLGNQLYQFIQVLGFLCPILIALISCFHLTSGVLGQKVNFIKSPVRTRACVSLSEAQWSPILLCVQ